ncbi:MAG: Asp-tRNA(Asn)/Glu-tRNA(Gln) amidotransferase GatCAB subunit A [Porphyrobacter sp.]|nr:Asp-tRNA(Asn)/Glu-tRNA(Gln) amidotransferase GatCAB subunit A [Porphyrobacter sp.]
MTVNDDPCFAGLMESARRVQAREASAVELAATFFDRIDALEESSRAWARLMRDSALHEAARADREIESGLCRGPLHGVPVGVKDLVDSAGVVTAAGMAIHADRVPDEDGTVLRRLRQAGAVVLGKLKTTEGATNYHHPSIPAPLNPWSAAHSAGYSSSGSGVAVASGQCCAALGSDTGGSIRIPSAFNGVTGIKPTWGRVSRAGVFPLVEFLDTVGPMARSAADAGAVLGVIAGPDPRDETAAAVPVPDYLAAAGTSLSGVTIGVDWDRIEAEVPAPLARALHDGADVLRDRGARIRTVAYPETDWARLFTLVAAGIGDAHRETYPSRANEYGPGLGGLVKLGQETSGVDVAAAINVADLVKARLRALFDDIDLLLVPALPMLTPLAGVVERMMGEDLQAAIRAFSYTVPFNVAGSPSITMPAGFHDGLPLAMQLVGRHFEETTLVRAGCAFQSATDWHLRRPPAAG